MNIVKKIDNFVKVENVIVSVYDKKNLETFIPALIQINPNIKIFSTGATYEKINGIIGNKKKTNLMRISDYTKQQETQGGLVKTLDFKIYIGLLTETYNKAHLEDIKRTGSVAIDMVVVNLYPFKDVIAKPSSSIEEARANIDIGGPSMIRAAAKNYLRVASVVSPLDYENILSFLKTNDSATSLKLRFELAKKAFSHITDYDIAISDYINSKTASEAFSCYF